MKASDKAKENAKRPDWLRQFTASADPEQFTAAFTAGALSVLRKAGQPATVEALRAVKHFRRGSVERYSTVAHGIENNAKLHEQVRLAPDVIFRAAQVRDSIVANDARNAAWNTALLFGVVGRSIDIDAEPYIKAGKTTLAARRVTADAKKLTADTRAKLIRPIWDEWTAANPKAKDPERFESVGELAHQRHPEAFRTVPGEQTIRDLRARPITGK